MNKAVVIFESKYGSTRRYAQWIATELSCPIFERKEFHPQDFSNYKVIIYGGGLYAGGVNGIKLITDNWKLLSDKKVILFTCGIANPEKPENVLNIREALAKALSSEILEQIQIFHLRGSLDYSRLSLMHRAMMTMLHRMLLKKERDTLTEEDKQLLDTYGKYIDFTVHESIYPLTEYAKSISIS